MKIGIAERGFSALSEATAAVREGGGEPIIGAVEDLLEHPLETILVRGWSDIVAVISTDSPIPILPVDQPNGLGPIDGAAIPDAIAAIQRGDVTVHSQTALTIDGGPQIAASEAILMTMKPATISEFAIRSDGLDVCHYRADGIVIASPPGSTEYARAAGGPIVSPAMTGLVVVPVAPYRTDPDHWIIDRPVECEITRDTGEVGLFLDGVDIASFGKDDSVTIAPTISYRSLRVPQSTSPYTVTNG